MLDLVREVGNELPAPLGVEKIVGTIIYLIEMIALIFKANGL